MGGLFWACFELSYMNKKVDHGPWYWLTTWLLFLMMMIFNARAMLVSSKFGRDIEANFWSRIWGRSLVQIQRMNCNQLAELRKRADRADQPVLFFLARANFWEKHAKNRRNHAKTGKNRRFFGANFFWGENWSVLIFTPFATMRRICPCGKYISNSIESFQIVQSNRKPDQ